MLDPRLPPLRIGLLTHSVNPRGGVVHTLELADALHDAGHDVTVFAPAQSGQSLFRTPRCHVELVPVNDRPTNVADMVTSRRAAYVKHLNALLEHEPFDVLHAQDGIGGNALADLCDAGAIDDFVRTVHHLDTFSDDRLMQWQERAFLRASQVLCVSQTWCDALQRDFGVSAALVQNGVDLTRYSTRVDASDAMVAARYGLKPGAPIVLAVGGIEERKNTLRLLQAFVAFRARRPDAQLIIVGGASLLDHDVYARAFGDALARSGLRTGPGEAVIITGTIPDAHMPALFRAADVLAMPSLREGFGLVVLEALASGTPVVASRIAPFTEYLGANESQSHCCWADPFDAASIADALERAIAPAHHAALAAATPAVCHRFSWAASAARHEALYRAHLALASRVPASLRAPRPSASPLGLSLSKPARRSLISESIHTPQDTPMPAMHFHLRWPDASETRCYSPSLVIKEYFAPGTSYPLPDFMSRSREALNIASDRVREKFGFACSMAMDQLAQIEATAERFEPGSRVEVLAFEE